MRRRTNSINIKITFLSYILECISGMFIIVVGVLRMNEFVSITMTHWMNLVDVLLYFVIIPCTYVLNREVTKRIILMENWYQGIKSIFRKRHSSNSGAEAPAQPPAPEARPRSRALIRPRNPNNRKIAPAPLVNGRHNKPQTSASGMDTPPRQAAMSLDVSKLHRNFLNKISSKVAPLPNIHSSNC